MLLGCPASPPINLSARLKGIPRAGNEIELITTLQSVTPLEDVRIDVSVSSGLEIIGGGEYWQGDVKQSEELQHLFEVRVVEPGLHVIYVYANYTGDTVRYGDSEEYWIQSWRLYGIEIPESFVKDQYGRFRSDEAENAFEEMRLDFQAN